MDADRVAKPVSLWGDKDNPGPPHQSHDRPIKVEGPILVGNVGSRVLYLCPLGDQVIQLLRVNSSTWCLLDVVTHQLQHPLRDLSC